MNEVVFEREGFDYRYDDLKIELQLEDYDNLTNLNKKLQEQNTKLKDLFISLAGLFADPYQDADNFVEALQILINKTSAKEITGRIGQRVYSTLRNELEKKHFGKFVVIDVDEEKVVAIEETPVKAMLEAKKIKNKNYFLRQIGIEIIIN